MTWSHAHAETLLGVVLGLLLSIPVGLYLSIYTGLIIARLARFEELRYELIRILQSIEWPPGTQAFVLTGGFRPYDITLIGADLLSLGHSTASEVVLRIDNQVTTELNRRCDFLTSDQKQQEFTKWMHNVRTMTPTKRVILDPRPQLYRRAKYDDKNRNEN